MVGEHIWRRRCHVCNAMYDMLHEQRERHIKLCRAVQWNMYSTKPHWTPARMWFSVEPRWQRLFSKSTTTTATTTETVSFTNQLEKFRSLWIPVECTFVHLYIHTPFFVFELIRSSNGSAQAQLWEWLDFRRLWNKNLFACENFSFLY